MSDDLLHDRPYETSGRLLRASPIRQGERTLAERVATYIGNVEVDQSRFTAYPSEVEAAALLREQQARIAELGRDLEAARVDAERYRALIATEAYVPVRFNPGCPWGLASGSGRPATKVELDAAIDAARERGEG